MSTGRAAPANDAPPTSDSRGSGPAASEGLKVPRLPSGKSQSPGHTSASAIEELEDQIAELENEGFQQKREIRRLKRENADLRAGAIAPATEERLGSKQQDDKLFQMEAKLSEMEAKLWEKDHQLSEMEAEKDHQLSEMGAELSEMKAKLLEKDDQLSEMKAKLLEKDNEIERLGSLLQCPSDSEHERDRQPEETLDLPVTSKGNKASKLNEDWPSWMPGQMVGESKNGSSTPGQDETGRGSQDEVEDSGSGSDHEERINSPEKPILSTTALAAAPDTGCNNLLHDASDFLTSEMEVMGLNTASKLQEPREGPRSPVRASDMEPRKSFDWAFDAENNPSGNPWAIDYEWNIPAPKPQESGPGKRSPVRGGRVNRPASPDWSNFSKGCPYGPGDRGGFMEKVKKIERNAAEEARGKRSIEQEKMLLSTQAPGTIREVHKWRKVDEQGKRKVTATDYQMNDPSQEDPARYTSEREAKGNDKDPEPTTAPQIDIPEQAKPANIKPSGKPGYVDRLAGVTWEEYLENSRPKAPKAPAPRNVIAEYEERG